MSNEIGQYLEWRFYEGLEWDSLKRPYNAEYHHYMKTLNHIGQTTKALYQLDHDPSGITILDANNYEEGLLIYMRHGKQPREFLIVTCNFVPVQRDSVKIGVPYRGTYEILLNSEAEEFGGNGGDKTEVFKTIATEFQGQPYMIELNVPALSVLYIKPKRVFGVNK